jgi:hypothetical protein
MLQVNGHHRAMRQLASGLLGMLETGCRWLTVLCCAMLSHADMLCTVLVGWAAATGTLPALPAVGGCLTVRVLLVLFRGHLRLLLAQELRLLGPLPASLGQLAFARACCTYTQDDSKAGSSGGVVLCSGHYAAVCWSKQNSV